MKTRFYFSHLMIALSLFAMINVFSSCSKDEEDEPWLEITDDNQSYNDGSYTESTGGNNSNSNNSNNRPSYETPEVGFYDCTINPTSIKVVYRIWNTNECKPSSAKIYYETSSSTPQSVNASINGVYATATITGLSKNTYYFFKCKVNSKGGSATSETIRLSTSY